MDRLFANLERSDDWDCSFWRPISHPVEDYPLAVCEAGSVNQDDLLECDHIRRKFVGSTVFLTHRQGYKWRYLSDHRPDEILVMKMFDSDPDVAKRKYSPLLCPVIFSARLTQRQTAPMSHSKTRKRRLTRVLGRALRLGLWSLAAERNRQMNTQAANFSITTKTAPFLRTN